MSGWGKLFSHGIEVLIKKAAVDPAFKTLLLELRGEAAKMIGLGLAPAEAAVLEAITAEQLRKVIDETEVPEANRRAFMGQAAVAMLAALGLGATGCEPDNREVRKREYQQYNVKDDHRGILSKGIRPSRPRIVDAPTTTTAASHQHAEELVPHTVETPAPMMDGMTTNRTTEPSAPGVRKGDTPSSTAMAREAPISSTTLQADAGTTTTGQSEASEELIPLKIKLPKPTFGHSTYRGYMEREIEEREREQDRNRQRE